MKLYDFPLAPSPRRARMFLAEKGLAFDTVLVDLTRAEQLGEAFRAINPSCTVPALTLDEGITLTDNAAIAAWAEAVQPEPALLGRTPLEKAEVASWNARTEFEGLWAVGEALRNSSPAMKDRAMAGPVNHAQIPELAQRGRERAALFFDVLEQRLTGRDFVATDRFSQADITAVVMVDFARAIRLKPDPERHPHLLRWRAAMAERPSVAL